MPDWKWVVTGTVAVVVASAIWWGPDLYRHLLPGTTGSIFVSGPQVYTRERLVNDRYREDAWLLKELNNSPNKSFGITASVQRVSRSSRSLSGGLGSPATTGEGEKPSSAVPPDKANPDEHSIALAATPFDRLHALLAYREQVRTLMIENQLDDRHDLRGNSLYRLRFDATVLPGWNTRVSANIVVSVLPPEGLIDDRIMDAPDNKLLQLEEERLAKLDHLSHLPANGERVEVWKRIYSRWLDSVEKRFEYAREEMRAAYDGNLFTPQDYDGLLSDIQRDVGFYAGQLDGQASPAPNPLPDQLQTRLTDIRQAIRKGSLTVDSIGAHDADSVAQFRTEIARLNRKDLVSNSAHGIFKHEIERLIQIINDEIGLLNDVIQYRIANPSLQATEVKQVPIMARTTLPAGDDGCGGLNGYDAASAVSGVENSGNFSTSGFSRSFYMDRAFQGRVSKSVLGLEPPPSATAQSGLGLNLIEDLRPLAVVQANFGVVGPAFRFRPQTLPLVVTNLESCIPESRRQFQVRFQTPSGVVWAFQDQLKDIDDLVPEYSFRTDIEAAAATIAHDAVTLGSSAKRVSVETVDAGLINFVRRAGRRLDAFSYAFTPSEPDELIASRTREERGKTLVARAAGTIVRAEAGAGVQVDEQTGSDASATATRKAVMGYGRQTTSAVPIFGWLIQPQERLEDDNYRQRPSQTSLTALISLPAWWEEIRVRVNSSWANTSGSLGIPTGRGENFTIELPVSFETVDASLFEQNDHSPVIHGWATDGITVRPCEEADIVIPGRRLWRSTVVTLGGQKADEIFVMPDMNGIIATFKPVLIPGTWTDFSKEFAVPITVWTSQGSAPLPYPAIFSPLASGHEARCPSSSAQSEPKELPGRPSASTSR